MLEEIRDLKTDCLDNDMKMLTRCTDIIAELYPDLNLRWAKIYGKRWSFISGKGNPQNFNSIKLRLNRDYGLFIDNPEILSRFECEELLQSLQECFCHENT